MDVSNDSKPSDEQSKACRIRLAVGEICLMSYGRNDLINYIIHCYSVDIKLE